MMISDSTTRALHAITDLQDLLRLAHGAAERVEKEVHDGDAFDHADEMSRGIRDLRQSAERLRVEVERFIKAQAAASLEHA
jgi:hypothetical protein